MGTGVTSLPLPMILLLGLLAVAASSDVATRRVSNRLVVLVALAAVVLRWEAEGFTGAATGVLGALALLLPLVLVWRMRIVGGGDVKLAAGAAIALAPERLPEFLVATALCGGLLCALILIADRRARSGVSAYATAAVLRCSTTRTRHEGATLPYAVAIFGGAAYALLAGA